MNAEVSKAGVSIEDTDRRLPASDELHLVERLRVVAGGEIPEDHITINDPKTYTSPITLKDGRPTARWSRSPCPTAVF